MRLPWLLAALVVSAALALMQAFALDNFLYWKYEWYDVPMHFLGGVAIAVFSVALLMHYRPRIFLGLVFLGAVGWEVFEFFAGFPREANFAFDTALDLLMDTLGAVAVYAVARFSVWRSR
jgi:hypothetical protein